MVRLLQMAAPVFFTGAAVISPWRENLKFPQIRVEDQGTVSGVVSRKKIPGRPKLPGQEKLFWNQGNGEIKC